MTVYIKGITVYKIWLLFTNCTWFYFYQCYISFSILLPIQSHDIVQLFADFVFTLKPELLSIVSKSCPWLSKLISRTFINRLTSTEPVFNFIYNILISLPQLALLFHFTQLDTCHQTLLKALLRFKQTLLARSSWHMCSEILPKTCNRFHGCISNTVLFHYGLCQLERYSHQFFWTSTEISRTSVVGLLFFFLLFVCVVDFLFLWTIFAFFFLSRDTNALLSTS